jgi:hypothetical protein
MMQEATAANKVGEGKDLAAMTQTCKESKGQGQSPRKMILIGLGISLLMFIVIAGTVYCAVNLSMETHTTSDGIMHVRGSSEPVRVATVESMGSVWEIPTLSTSNLARLESIIVHVDMTGMPEIAGLAEVSVKVASAYKAQGSTDKAFLTTPEGYVIEINGAEHSGTITMGSKGTFGIIGQPKDRRLYEKSVSNAQDIVHYYANEQEEKLNQNKPKKGPRYPRYVKKG